MELFAENRLDYSGKCFISHSDCYNDARKVADMIEERFPKLNGKVVINSVGTTIGSHYFGPGTVALFFWGDTRKTDISEKNYYTWFVCARCRYGIRAFCMCIKTERSAHNNW